MIVKTNGIVIKYLKYRETSIIAQIFTEKYGLGSFIVNGIRSPRPKKSIGYFQPLSLLELVLYMRPNREIQRLSEYKYLAPTHRIQQDVRKSAIVLFLSEVLGKILKHEQGGSHGNLFHFLYHSILKFDQLSSKIENFHLHFLLKILPYIGLSIGRGEELIENMEHKPLEGPHTAPFISRILQSDFEDDVGGTGNLRFKTLELVFKYLQYHTTELSEVKSLKVLHQVFQ